MPDYDDTNKFTLFKNDKEGNEKRPDYTGKINVNGEELRLSAWIRTPKNGGDKFMSGEVSPPYEKGAQNGSQAASQAKTDTSFNDDIPF